MPPERKRTIDPEAKRRAILDAAATLFVRDGYSATSTASIAALAGVATGTVFRYFPDKAALLEALQLRVETLFADAMSEAWEASRREPAPERLAPMFEALFDVAAAQRALLPILHLAVANASADGRSPGSLVRERIAAQYAEAVAAGEFRALDPVLAASIAHGMVDGAMRHWMSDPHPRRRRETIEALTALGRAAFRA